MEKLGNVQVVMWDCDNTLWFHKGKEAELFSRHLGIKEVDELQEEFEQMAFGIPIILGTEKVTHDKIISIISEKMPILEYYQITAEQFLKEWTNASAKLQTPNEEAIQILQYCNEKGIKNIVETDWLTSVQHRNLKAFGMLEYIEEIHSAEQSFMKSNPKRAEEIPEHLKKCSVIVGDSLKSDIAFGNYAGIPSVWFNPKGKKNDTKFKPDFEIKSLLELKNMF